MQPPLTTTLQCPAGFTGVFQRSQTFNSSANTCAYNPSTDNSSSACVPVTPPTFGYNWRPIAIGGGGQITGIDLHPNGTLRLARTANYGAYIWNGNRWDQLVTAERMPVTDRNITSLGVVDVVAAPSDAQRLYMFFNERVFRSDNQGATWRRTADLPAATIGAFASNSNGYKMAVDPVNPNVVFVGTSIGGAGGQCCDGKRYCKGHGPPELRGPA